MVTYDTYQWMNIALKTSLFIKKDAVLKVLSFILLFNNLWEMTGWEASLFRNYSGNLWKLFLRSNPEIKNMLMDWHRAGLQVMIFTLSLYNSSVSLRLVHMSNLIHSFIFFFFKKILLCAKHCSRQEGYCHEQSWPCSCLYFSRGDRWYISSGLRTPAICDSYFCISCFLLFRFFCRTEHEDLMCSSFLSWQIFFLTHVVWKG